MKQSITPVQIRFCDVDKLGHVNNAVYLSYFESARMHFFHDVIGHMDWSKLGVILGRVEIDYLLPVLLTDKIFVRTWCTRIGTKSFDLSYTVFKKANETETDMATGMSVLVCYDYELKKSVLLPEEWRKYLST